MPRGCTYVNTQSLFVRVVVTCSIATLTTLGATTLEEYRKYIEKDAALERRFQPVDVPEPSEKECVEILRGLTGKYEEHHGCIYTEDALKVCVEQQQGRGWVGLDQVQQQGSTGQGFGAAPQSRRAGGGFGAVPSGCIE